MIIVNEVLKTTFSRFILHDCTLDVFARLCMLLHYYVLCYVALKKLGCHA